MTTSQNFGFGKTIILGEHFVVHGLPALVGALPLKTFAQVTSNCSNNLIFIDDRPKAPGFIANKSKDYLQMVENILNFLKIEQRNFTITIAGNLLVTCGGIGASAACAVAVTRAFNQKFKLNLSNSKINQVALFAESAVHCTPSGIDNTAAVFGGCFKFTRPCCITPISLTKPLKIILVDSGKKTNTKIMISTMKSFLNGKPDQSQKIFDHYKEIFDQGFASLNNLDLHKLGWCMHENHKLLQHIGISCSKLDFIVNKALSLGAFGAKLTGTGGGGLALILVEDKKQDKIAKEIESCGYITIKTEIK